MPTDERSRYERVPIPEETHEERVTTFGELLHPYTPDEAVLEGQRCLQCAMPFCVQGCPIVQDCREYILLVGEKKYDEAAKVTLRENPLAMTLCKTCYHYCEDACIMAERGVPIAIRHLKRAAMEMGKSDLLYVPSKPLNQRIAIVGAGPAGLMAAWELCLRGYSVTIYEEQAYLGGQAATIPKYHMDGNEVEIDVARFRNFDCTFKMSQKVGVDLTISSLLEGGYRAVYLSIGSSDHRTLGVPGENLPGVIPAIDLLRDINEGPPVELGKKIVVVGGGDVAMDAVRSVRRLAQGASVTVVYHNTQDKMSAGTEESQGAMDEGVQFMFQLAPMRVLGTGHVEGLEVRKVVAGPKGPTGRPTVTTVPGSEQIIECDTVVLGVGEKANLTGLPPELDLATGSQGWPQGKRDDTMTGIEGVFASGGKSVVYAMAAGTKSAVGIDAYLRKKDGKPPIPRPDPFGEGNAPQLPKGYGGPTWKP
jgi:NADPH-dependent glutamate synthase beta subunit-like oxidoreductase